MISYSQVEDVDIGQFSSSCHSGHGSGRCGSSSSSTCRGHVHRASIDLGGCGSGERRQGAEALEDGGYARHFDGDD
jgi:hypothetical protein